MWIDSHVVLVLSFAIMLLLVLVILLTRALTLNYISQTHISQEAAEGYVMCLYNLVEKDIIPSTVKRRPELIDLFEEHKAKLRVTRDSILKGIWRVK